MNSTEKIELLRELKKQKDKLEKQIKDINIDIEKQISSCSHIGVNLYQFAFSGRFVCRCLLCGEKKYLNKSFENNYIVHAEEYLPQYDIHDIEQFDEKFDNIQTLALGILRDNPDMSSEELTIKLNNLIQGSKRKRLVKEENK